MKTLHTILTILFIIALLLGLPAFVKTFNMLSYIDNPNILQVMAVTLGNLLAYMLIPGLIWLARYFVGKNLKNKKNS